MVSDKTGAPSTGEAFRAPFVHAWTLRGGRIVRLVQYVDTVLVQRAVNAD